MKTAPLKILFLSLLTLGISLGLSVSSHAQTAKTWVVCPTGSGATIICDFTGPQGIQQAIDAATDGDTIHINAGNYAVTLPNGSNANIIINNKNLTITGAGITTTTITVTDNSVQSYGIKIQGTSQLQITNISLKYNSISNIHVGGIITYNTSHLILKNVEIANFTGSGLGLQDASLGDIKFNNIHDNGDVGVDAENSGNLNLRNNLIWNHGLDGLYTILGASSSSTIINNVFNQNNQNNTSENAWIEGSNITFENNIISNSPGKGLVTPTTNINNITMKYNDSFGNAGGNYDIHVQDSRDYQFDPSYGTTFHLNPGSLLINAGDPGILDPDGSASDMGAYGGPEACGLDPTLPGCGGQGTPTPGSSGTPAPGTTISPAVCDRSHGDADCSGTVDMVDYLYYIRYNACINSQQLNCLGIVPVNVNLDLNGDGAVNDMDRVVIITAMRGPVLPSNTITPPAQ